MAQQGTVTISGFVGADPQGFGKEGGPAACSFRIGCTPRYFNAMANEWCDRPTTWITVKAFRTLAQNVLSSLHKGDPVVATGTLATEEWTREDTKHTKMVMEATSVGHDLSFGTSVFHRVKPGMREPGGAGDASAAATATAQNEVEGHEVSAVAHNGRSEAQGGKNGARSRDAMTGGLSNNDGDGDADVPGDDPWDASEVFEETGTADRLVASVG
ncbi:single-stranded DNA-binding protein [Bifidobacterium sp. ESL0775]|uniref:single-stranded DNA-binding protein n=1 Tax=Bifidobacterium sp. ESL0775 TaxID=2983230 RepID=UPI0023F98826|nr:single-stranded DNA-binding protein [Bifidobacterium sp. ESL0775]WEV68889.1 single-stranded DNA-binding protein [Bifidobacterium sp. ESL0775]